MLITGKVTEQMMLNEGMIRGGRLAVPYSPTEPLYYGYELKYPHEMKDDDFDKIEEYFLHHHKTIK